MKVQRDGRSFTVDVTADGEGLVSHAGSALLARVADKTGLTEALSQALAPMRERRSPHDPGNVVRDLAVMLADGGEALCDLRAVRDQQPLFGGVSSDATAYRTIEWIAAEAGRLEALRGAGAQARGAAWALGISPSRLTVDLDATLIGAHSEKEGAAGNYKGGFGFHPLLAYFEETSEAAAAGQRRRQHRSGRLVAQAERLRPGGHHLGFHAPGSAATTAPQCRSPESPRCR